MSQVQERWGENTADDYSSVTFDNHIRDDQTSTNNGGDTLMPIGFIFSSFKSRALIKFDIKTQLDTLGATLVNSAEFNFFPDNENDAVDRAISLYRCMQDWVEGEATPSIFSTANSWNTVMAQANDDSTGEDSTIDRRLTAEASAIITVVNTYFQYNLVTAAENWRAATWSQYGVIAINDDEATASSGKRHVSSEGTDGERPFMEITYTLLDAVSRRRKSAVQGALLLN